MAKGGSPQIIEAPAPPQVASPVQQSKEYYTDVLPLQVAANQQYGPQLAAQDYELFQQYAPQYSQTLANIDKQLYPQTAALQENLASQALAGMNEPVPTEIAQQYASDFNAGLGMNVNAPIGVSDRNIALIKLQKEWGDYYRNLGLSVAQRQPLQGPAQPQFQSPSAGLPNYYGAAANYAGNQMQGYSTSLSERIIRKPSAGNGATIGSLVGTLGGNLLVPGMGSVAGPIGAQIGGLF